MTSAPRSNPPVAADATYIRGVAMPGALSRAHPGDIALGFGGVLAGLVAGMAVAGHGDIGMAIALALGLAVLATVRPVIVAVLAVPGVYLAERLGGSASGVASTTTGVAYADVLLAAATMLALVFAVPRGVARYVSTALAGVAFYLCCLLPTVLLNHGHRADLEWLHRLVLVAGSLIVGAWIAQEGATRLALRSLIGVSCGLSVLAVWYTVSHRLAPAYPLGLNKNFLGALFAAVITVVICAPRAAGLRPRAAVGLGILLTIGLLATQSRGGMLAAAFGVLIGLMLDRRAHTRPVKVAAVLVVLMLTTATYLSVRDQLNQSSADVNNSSIGVRRSVERQSLQIWRTSPGYGVGLKYFATGQYPVTVLPPTNIVDNELAESGVIGLVGFAGLQGMVLIAGLRRRRDDPLVAAAVGAVFGLLVHGMVDTYWIAGSVALPYLLLGLGLGASAAAPTGGYSRAETSAIDDRRGPVVVSDR